MRFRVQFRDGDRWRYVTGADSGWRTLKRSAGRAIESGWSFEFEPPAKPITFRGVVRFRWVRDGRIVAAAREITGTGHRSTAGRRPRGLLRRHLLDRLREQPRVVGDHAGDAERLERADPARVVDRPDVELAARVRGRPPAARA